MKAKTTLLIQAIGMYLMQLPMSLLVIVNSFMGSEASETLTKPLLITALVLTAMMIPVCILNVTVSIRSAVKDQVDPTKSTMVIKLCLIPWYVINFLIGLVFVGVFFNPFMMIAIPLIIGFLSTTAYVLMLSSSVGDIAYFLHNKATNKLTLTPGRKVSILFLFLFCFDVLGAILLYKKQKNDPSQD